MEGKGGGGEGGPETRLSNWVQSYPNQQWFYSIHSTAVDYFSIPVAIRTSLGTRCSESSVSWSMEIAMCLPKAIWKGPNALYPMSSVIPSAQEIWPWNFSTIDCIADCCDPSMQHASSSLLEIQPLTLWAGGMKGTMVNLSWWVSCEMLIRTLMWMLALSLVYRFVHYCMILSWSGCHLLHHEWIISQVVFEDASITCLIVLAAVHMEPVNGWCSLCWLFVDLQVCLKR